MLPLVHAHSFVVTIGIGACLALSQCAYAVAKFRSYARSSWQEALVELLKPWAVFFAIGAVIGGPQVLWAMHGSAVSAGNFLGWEFGWDHGTENVVWFWIKNTGLFIPLLVVAVLWNMRVRLAPARLVYFCLPFALCFLLPNLLRLAPWIWDNIKVLTYWWIAASPLVAIVLTRLWRSRGATRVVAVALLLVQISAGMLDVWRAASGAVERQTFDQSGVNFADLIKRSTPPNSLILHAPTYNDPVYLTGRRSFMGYPGHLWSHGIEFSERDDALKTIYTGAPEAAGLVEKLGIEYVVVGPLETAWLKEQNLTLNMTLFKQYTKVGEQDEYQLYRRPETKTQAAR
jgi:hypothetical protein